MKQARSLFLFLLLSLNLSAAMADSLKLSSPQNSSDQTATSMVATIDHQWPGFHTSVATDRQCAQEALSAVFDMGEASLFNPFLPHCQVLHIYAGFNAMAGNLPGMIYLTATAMMSGCVNTVTTRAIYGEVYDNCTARKGN